MERYIKDVILWSLGNTKKPDELIYQERKRRAVSVWGQDPSNRNGVIEGFLKQGGFLTIATKQSSGTTVSPQLVAILQEQTPKSILSWLRMDG